MVKTREQERQAKARYRARLREKAGADAPVAAARPSDSGGPEESTGSNAPVGAVVLQMPPPKPPSDTVVGAVCDELAGSPGAALHPALVATALRLAATLDDEKARPHHAATARALGEVLGKLGGSSTSKLAILRANREPRPPA